MKTELQTINGRLHLKEVVPVNDRRGRDESDIVKGNINHSHRLIAIAEARERVYSDNAKVLQGARKEERATNQREARRMKR